MIKTQQKINRSSSWELGYESNDFKEEEAHLVFVFGSSALIQNKDLYEEVTSFYPNAEIVSCSTAGDVFNNEVIDDSVVVTALSFEKTKIKTVKLDVTAIDSSTDMGEIIAQKLDQKDLSHVLILSSGMKVNGGYLIEGLKKVIPSSITITGGLAADGSNFVQTFAGLNQTAKENQLILIGFYGNDIKIGSGTKGGWDGFGVKRVVTKSKDGVLYELDGKPVLPLYKKYLGEELSKELPASGLFFPLKIKDKNNESTFVRTIFGISEEDQSITFSGNVPEGSEAQLMKANIGRLINGAEESAEQTNSENPQFALIISCFGRKFLLKQRTEDEIEAVNHILGDKCLLAGFYSYGEIAPSAEKRNSCELHNQTMTITTFEEL